MKKIRLHTFETNSSSTHALCILPTEKYNKFFDQDINKLKEEQLYLSFDSKDVITYEEVTKLAKEYYDNCRSHGYYNDTEFDEDFINDYMSDTSIYSKASYNNLECDYELFNEEYDDIIAFGYYGGY